MSTTWTLTATEICRDALEHMEAVGIDQEVSAEDEVACLRALDAVLKALPLTGYLWPKLSGDTALTWAALTPQVITLPADYYDYPIVRKTVNSQDKALTQIPHASWVQMTDRTATAAEPTHFYISPAKVLYFWPVPTVDPVAKLQYQKIVDDASVAVSPDVLQIWKSPLGWGVADELGLKYGVGKAERDDISNKWAMHKAMALNSSIPFEDISFSVDG